MAFSTLHLLPNKGPSALQSRGSCVPQPCRVFEYSRRSSCCSLRLDALCPPHKAPGIARRCLVSQSGWQPDYQASEREQESASAAAVADDGSQHAVHYQQPAHSRSNSSSSTEQPAADNGAAASSQPTEEPGLLMVSQTADSPDVRPPERRQGSPPRRPVPRGAQHRKLSSQLKQTGVDGRSSMDQQRTSLSSESSASSNPLSCENVATASAPSLANDSPQYAAQHQQPVRSSSIGTEPSAGNRNSVTASSQQTDRPGRPMPSQAADSPNVLPTTYGGGNSNVQQQMPASTGGSNAPGSMVEACVSPNEHTSPPLLMRSSRLVELLQSVSEDKLTEIKKELLAVVGPVKEGSTDSLEESMEDPLHIDPSSDGSGSGSGHPTEMLLCGHGLPVKRWTAGPGPYEGKTYYRCPHPIKLIRNCYLALPPDIADFTPEQHQAAQRSAEVWKAPKKPPIIHPRNHSKRLQWKKELAEKSYWKKELAKSRYALDEGGKFQHEEGWQHKQRAGAWGESYLYLWLKEVLPDFDERNWVSSNRRFLFKDPKEREWWDIDDGEPAFDFQYEDVEGVLGVVRAMYFIGAKANRGVAVHGGGQHHKLFVTAREWQLARQKHQKHGVQGDEAYVIISLDRMDDKYLEWGGPRLAAVLVDPYGMAADPEIQKQLGIIRVEPTTSSGTTMLCEYPVLPGVLKTAPQQRL